MRKIESEMQAAIVEQRNWSKANTSVTVDSEGDVDVLLHGHRIATISTTGNLKLSSCGYQTTTTKSRLNAILDCFFNNLAISQKDFVWYIGNDMFFDGYQIIR